jgi:hypothetical protein
MSKGRKGRNSPHTNGFKTNFENTTAALSKFSFFFFQVDDAFRNRWRTLLSVDDLVDQVLSRIVFNL